MCSDIFAEDWVSWAGCEHFGLYFMQFFHVNWAVIVEIATMNDDSKNNVTIVVEEIKPYRVGPSIIPTGQKCGITMFLASI